jgi:heat-inducible transcriptional repressor
MLPMTNAALDERSREVLQTLIQLHVTTGDPVGSESLSRALNRTLSPATLRNIMADLERLGYLDHPHTSAGRLPTDDGYRLYVDALLSRQQQPLPPREAAAIDSQLRPGDAAPGQVLESASQVLSRLTRNVGFVLAPEIGRAAFHRVDLVRLHHPRILVVMVASTGMVTNKVIEVEEQLDQAQLQTCATYLNTHFTGMTLEAIRQRLLELMREEKALYDDLLKRVVSVGERAFSPTADDEAGSVYLDGTANMLEQTEDLERMRALFKTFEEKNRLVQILGACMSGEGLRIFIGHENPAPDLADLAVVTASYPIAGEAGWGVGVMGSTRMEYARVIALVDHVARVVSRALGELRG